MMVKRKIGHRVSCLQLISCDVCLVACAWTTWQTIWVTIGRKGGIDAFPAFVLQLFSFFWFAHIPFPFYIISLSLSSFEWESVGIFPFLLIPHTHSCIGASAHRDETYSVAVSITTSSDLYTHFHPSYTTRQHIPLFLLSHGMFFMLDTTCSSLTI